MSEESLLLQGLCTIQGRIWPARSTVLIEKFAALFQVNKRIQRGIQNSTGSRQRTPMFSCPNNAMPSKLHSSHFLRTLSFPQGRVGKQGLWNKKKRQPRDSRRFTKYWMTKPRTRRNPRSYARGAHGLILTGERISSNTRSSWSASRPFTGNASISKSRYLERNSSADSACRFDHV